jgi:hypothetical protein
MGFSCLKAPETYPGPDDDPNEKAAGPAIQTL